MVRQCALLLLLASAGCAAASEPSGAVGYVLLDDGARSAGKLAQGDWSDAPLLPVALDATEPVSFASRSGRSVFDLRPGMLAHVHGAGGAIEWLRVGEDVRDDRIL